MEKFVPVIGLEVHIELSTNSKMFCQCPADHFAKEPNTQTCPVCLGLPGALPYANRKAIESCIKLGLALDSQISRFSKFDRKHYFYPDLPKAYQISQYDLPLCSGGQWVSRKGVKIRITRIHQEEDTGKLIHTIDGGKKLSLVDYNRSGVPLVEMVTEPDFTDLELVDEFLRHIQKIVRYLGISTADMEKGSMRLEANVSLRKLHEKNLPSYKVELKNINSFKFLQKAVEAEIKRQAELLEKGETPTQETRGYDEERDRTFSQRAKEGSADYRYFPEPDIPPVVISEGDIERLKLELPELPEKKAEKYRKLGIKESYIEILVSDQARATYFEEAVRLAKSKAVSVDQLVSVMVNKNLDKKYEEPALLVTALYKMMKKSYASANDVELACQKVVSENPKAVNDYRSGKTQVIGFLVGLVQKELKGSGDPKTVLGFLRKIIETD